MKHKHCGGWWESFTIREHGFCFMRCSACGAHLGGQKVADEIVRLMQIKVRPTIRKV